MFEVSRPGPAALAAGSDLVTLRREFAPRLVAWQREHGRHRLPWQQTRDPYRVWLSEIMLQQTQVSTVLAYYERFLARFPDVVALADASLDEVLALWSGLGYYSRARNLHRCAQEVRDRHGGRFPPTAAGLAELPGIGRSTAAAVAAFCFGEKAAILDGNVKRVLGRVLAFEGDLSQARAERELWAHAEALLPDEGIDAYTQGLMDLGAGLCSVRSPTCLLCPVASLCRARALGQPERFPVKTRRIARGRRESWWLWIEHEREVCLVPRPARGVWAGLLSLPEFDSAEGLHAALDGWQVEAQPQPRVEHALTHFDWVLHPVKVRPLERPAWPHARWIPYARLSEVGLPAPLRRLLQG